MVQSVMLSISAFNDGDGTEMAYNPAHMASHSVPFDLVESDDKLADIRPQLKDTASAPIDNTPSPAPEDDQRRRRISVGRFRAIMAQSEKQYDVEEIVEELKDEDDFIALDDISGFRKRINTIVDDGGLDE